MNPVRLGVEFARGEPARWVGHLDLARAMARAVRRAGLPLAYSQGFNPHPKLSFALPLAVGMTSRRDYLEVGLAEPVAPVEFSARLNSQLPPGLTCLQAWPLPEGSPALAARVGAATYAVRWPGSSPEALTAACRRVLEAPSLPDPLPREGKTARDLRPLILGLEAQAIAGGALVRMTLSAGTASTARPVSVLGLLAEAAGVTAPAGPVERTGILAQGPTGLVPLCDS
ncbi:MAG: TIGR03936 family radical SAM-associated protein [Bacillota bacterium]